MLEKSVRYSKFGTAPTTMFSNNKNIVIKNSFEHFLQSLLYDEKNELLLSKVFIVFLKGSFIPYRENIVF